MKIHLQENTLFDLDLGLKATQNVSQYPLHHVTYSAAKLEVASSNGLGGDTFTRNVTDASTDGGTDRWTTGRLWYEIKTQGSSETQVFVMALYLQREFF